MILLDEFQQNTKTHLRSVLKMSPVLTLNLIRIASHVLLFLFISLN